MSMLLHHARAGASIALIIAVIVMHAPARGEEAGVTVHAVTIENFLFAPARLEVHAGDAIEFTNRDFAPHAIIEDGGTRNTGALKYGASGRIVVTQTGSFTYHCAYHPQMKGSVSVLPAKAGGH